MRMWGKPAVFLRLAVVLLGVVVLSTQFLGTLGERPEPAKKSATHIQPSVLTFEGESVSKEEFMHVLKGESGKLFAQISREYGITSSKGFWYTLIDNKVPAEVLKERVLEKIKRIKMEQVLMKRHGLVDDISFSGFLAQMQAENARRKEYLKKKLPIYGAVQFEARAYYKVLHKNRFENLCNTLAAGELQPSPEDLEAYYAKNRQELPSGSLEEMADVVRNRVVRKKCEALITKSLEKAQVAVNQEVYASIRVE